VTTGECAVIGLTLVRYRTPTTPRYFRCRYIVHHYRVHYTKIGDAAAPSCKLKPAMRSVTYSVLQARNEDKVYVNGSRPERCMSRRENGIIGITPGEKRRGIQFIRSGFCNSEKMTVGLLANEQNKQTASPLAIDKPQ